MATENQYGKIFIPEALHDKDNRFGDPRYDRGGAFIEDLQPHMWLEFCERWLHLAGYADLIDDIIEYYNTIATVNAPITFRWEDGRPVVPSFIKSNGLALPVTEVKDLEKCFIKYKEPNFDKIQDYYLAQKLKELM